MSHPVSGNQLIEALSATDRKAFVSDLQLVHIKAHESLLPSGWCLSNVYFPTGAVISAICISNDATMDVRGVGREGMLGSDALSGSERTYFELVCQIGGSMLHMPAHRFREHLRARAGLRDIAERYAFEALTLMTQSVACNGLHNIAQRCARWLLITGDRVASDEFELTHYLLSRMLGVRRAGVSVAVNRLQKLGLIRYRLGFVKLLDRQALEAESCDCYGVVTRESSIIDKRRPRQAWGVAAAAKRPPDS